MRQLPDRPDLDQLHRQARELQRTADPPINLSQAQLSLARKYGFPSWPNLKAEVERRRAGGMVTIRPISSIEELIQAEQVIAAQFPPRRSAASHGLEALKARFPEDRGLMLVADRAGQIVGGALALRAGNAVKVDVIALEPDVRRLGLGRRLMEAIEAGAIRSGARGIYLGGASAETRGFYWRLGFSGHKSLMQKGLPLTARAIDERRR